MAKGKEPEKKKTSPVTKAGVKAKKGGGKNKKRRVLFALVAPSIQIFTPANDATVLRPFRALVRCLGMDGTIQANCDLEDANNPLNLVPGVPTQVGQAGAGGVVLIPPTQWISFLFMIPPLMAFPAGAFLRAKLTQIATGSVVDVDVKFVNVHP